MQASKLIIYLRHHYCNSLIIIRDKSAYENTAEFSEDKLIAMKIPMIEHN
jgi:hypothetical protein